MPKKKTTKTRKKEKKYVEYAKVYIKSTFNNIIISVTDMEGNVLVWGSAGTAGFKGTRKGTPFAAQQAAQQVAKKAMGEHRVKDIAVYVKGPGAGREAAIRALSAAGLNIRLIKDITPIPHNGCRPPKRRRV